MAQGGDMARRGLACGGGLGTMLPWCGVAKRQVLLVGCEVGGLVDRRGVVGPAVEAVVMAWQHKVSMNSDTKKKKGPPIDGEPVHDMVVAWLAGSQFLCEYRRSVGQQNTKRENIPYQNRAHEGDGKPRGAMAR